MIRFEPAIVYVLCFATSLTCAALLARSYRQRRTRLLLWVAIGFGALAVNNLFLVLDMLVLRNLDLWAARQLATATCIVVLLYGFIWEAHRGG